MPERFTVLKRSANKCRKLHALFVEMPFRELADNSLKMKQNYETPLVEEIRIEQNCPIMQNSNEGVIKDDPTDF